MTEEMIVKLELGEKVGEAIKVAFKEMASETGKTLVVAMKEAYYGMMGVMRDGGGTWRCTNERSPHNDQICPFPAVGCGTRRHILPCGVEPEQAVLPVADGFNFMNASECRRGDHLFVGHEYRVVEATQGLTNMRCDNCDHIMSVRGNIHLNEPTDVQGGEQPCPTQTSS